MFNNCVTENFYNFTRLKGDFSSCLFYEAVVFEAMVQSIRKSVKLANVVTTYAAWLDLTDFVYESTRFFLTSLPSNSCRY